MVTMKQLQICCVLLLAMSLNVACSKKDEEAPTGGGEVETTVEGEQYRATIGPDGGVMTLLDGATLEVPAGALGEPTEITAVVPPADLRTEGVIKYVFLPSGLEFSKPATLRVPLSDVPEGGPIEGWQWSELNPVGGEGEITSMQPLQPVVGEHSEQQAVYELDHFSVVFLFIVVSEYAYITVDIPAEYLLPGDILFTLTSYGGIGWNPGHVGMFTGGRDDCNMAPSQEVIEATDNAVRRWYLGKNENGSGFRTEAAHRYLGARRNQIEPLTAMERQQVKDFVTSKLGIGYDAVFSKGGTLDLFTAVHPTIDDDDELYNCVGLVEHALDQVGKGTLPGLNQILGSTPLEMYKTTSPVTEIQAYAGDKIEIPVYGTVISPRSPDWFTSTRGQYCGGQRCCDGGACNEVTIEAKNVPGDASWSRLGAEPDVEAPPGSYLLTWDTSEEDAGRQAFITFELTSNDLSVRTDADSNREHESLGVFTKTQPLLIEILPCPEEDSFCGDDEASGTEDCDGSDHGGESCDSLGLGDGELGCNDDCTHDTSQCAGGGMCGNNVAESADGEQCDGADLNGETCESVGAGTGTLACSGQCMFDTSGCSVPPMCGNDMIEGAEVCDGSDLGGEDCASRGFVDGTLACAPTCDAFVTDACSRCGNGMIDPGEMCDQMDLAMMLCSDIPGFDGGTLACDSTCGFDTSGCFVDSACIVDTGVNDFDLRSTGFGPDNVAWWTSVGDLGAGYGTYVSWMDNNCVMQPPVRLNISSRTPDMALGSALVVYENEPAGTVSYQFFDTNGAMGAAFDTAFDGAWPKGVANIGGGAAGQWAIIGPDVLILDDAGTVLASAGPTGLPAFTSLTDTYGWYNAGVASAVSIMPSIRFERFDLTVATSTLAQSTYSIAAPASGGTWRFDALQTASGDFEAWMVDTMAANTLVVQPVAQDLTAGTPVNIALTGGTIDRLQVATVSTGAWLYAEVIDGMANETLRAFELTYPLPNTLDLSGGTEVAPNATTIRELAVGPDGGHVLFYDTVTSSVKSGYLPLP